MKRYLLLLLLPAFLACKMANQTTSPATKETRLVALQAHGCRGFCPQYKLTFHTTGLVEYEGLRSVVKMGLDSFKLTPAEVQRVQTAVKTANVWQYPERIENEVADAPMSTLTVYAEGRMKSTMSGVGRPKPLSELETLLKDLTEAHGVQVKEPPAGSGRN